MLSILPKSAKNSFFVLCVYALCACNTQKRYTSLKIFDNIKQEFAEVDFKQKTALLVFYEGNCSGISSQIKQALENKIKPNTQKIGLYLKMNAKSKFGYQALLDETKNDIKWVSMKNRSLFGLISQGTKSNKSPFLVNIKNNRVISVSSF